MTTALKLGTRGSKLALWQAEWVRAALARCGVAAELVIIKTRIVSRTPNKRIMGCFAATSLLAHGVAHFLCPFNALFDPRMS